MNVSEILKQKNVPLVTVKKDTSVLTAAHRIRLANVGCVIVSEDGKHPDGIVAARDFTYNLATHWGEHPKGNEFSYLLRPVSDIMHGPVKTCTPDDDLSDVLQIMWKFHFLHIPVVDGAGELCGVVSIDDVIYSTLQERELENKVLHERIMLSGERPIE